MNSPGTQRRSRPPLRPPSAKSGPLRWGAHALLGSGRFPTLRDIRANTRRGDHPYERGLRVFAVEPTSLQLDWAVLGPGEVTIHCADTTEVVQTTGGPGSVTLDNLPQARNLTVTLTGDGIPRARNGKRLITIPISTTTPPPGEEIGRIATISDLHVGETSFGYLHTITEEAPENECDAHPLRAARAATQEALTWGAQRLVCKGDIVDQSHPGHWRDILNVLDEIPIPVHLISGNHEVKRRRSIEPVDALTQSRVHYTDRLDTIDIGGARILLANSTVPDHEHGSLEPVADELVSTLRAAPTGALVLIHHHLRSGRSLSAWPVGIPNVESTQTLDRIAQANPATLISSGHVHRNRYRQHGPLVLTCVGSAKDYPGVWAGYVFHEGGIRQVIRRVSDIPVMEWTERTGDALLGYYRFWTPSTLQKRCFSLTWPHT